MTRNPNRQAEQGDSAPAHTLTQNINNRWTEIQAWIRQTGSGPWRVLIPVTAVVLAVLGATAWFVEVEKPVVWLRNRRPFPADQLNSARNALIVEGVDLTIDHQGAIGVAATDLAKAIDILEQKGLLTKSLREEKEISTISPFADIATQQKHVLVELEKDAEAAISSRFEQVLAVDVVLSSHRAVGFQPPKPSQALVLLTPDPKYRLSPEAQDDLAALVASMTGLDPTRDLTMFLGDQRVRDANDPSIRVRSKTEATALDWEASIATVLSKDIPGIRVSIAIERAETSTEENRTGIRKIAVNQALSLNRRDEQVDVLVEIPGNYLRDRYEATYPNQEWQRTQFEEFFDFTKNRINRIVARVIPDWEHRGQLDVQMLPLTIHQDDTPTSGEARWLKLRWVMIGAVGTISSLVVVVAFQGRLPKLKSHQDRVDRDTVFRSSRANPRDNGVTGANDRVRELVRRDPGTGAAVLRRWIQEGLHQ